MKKTILLLSVAALMAAGITSCGTHKTKAEACYVCPMDTNVHSDTPGKCPKCGMDLELKK